MNYRSSSTPSRFRRLQRICALGLLLLAPFVILALAAPSLLAQGAPSAPAAAAPAAPGLVSTELDTGPAADEFANPPDHAERHPSGLVSLLLREGQGKVHPDSNDMVALHFTAWDRSGKVFRTTRGSSGKAATMSLANVFPGWKEGLALMVQGEKRRLWVPGHLGPQNSQAGPRSAVFDVELLAVVPVPNAPKSLRQPDPGAERLSNGIHSLVVTEGQGQVADDPAGRILAHYVVWNSKGEVIDSTYARGRPTAFMLDGMTPALSDVLQTMKVGERRNLWVPEFAHQGQWPGSPKGMLVFDVMLMHILPKGALQPKADGEAAKKPSTGET